MAHNRRIFDNIEHVAKELIELTQDPKNVRSLIGAVVAAEDEYDKLFGYYFLGSISQMLGYRNRKKAFRNLVTALNQSDNTTAILKGLLFFTRPAEEKEIIPDTNKPGEWFPSSGNTNLMYEWIALLPQYKELDPDPRASLTLQNIRRIHDLIEAHVKSLDSSQSFIKKNKQTIDAELTALRAMPKADKTLKASVIGKVFDKNKEEAPVARKDMSEVKKLDRNKFADITARLTVMFQQEAENQRLSAKVVKATIVQEHPFMEIPLCTSPGVDIPVPPPPPSAKQPSKLVLNEAHLLALNSLFAGHKQKLDEANHKTLTR